MIGPTDLAKGPQGEPVTKHSRETVEALHIQDWGENKGADTYTAHEVQECGSDGWVGFHGVMHDQDGWF